jgi:excisionase family DNA binding protein
MITTAQAADILGISRQRLHQLIAGGRISAKRDGRLYLLDEQEVEAFAAKERRDGRPTKTITRQEIAAELEAGSEPYLVYSTTQETFGADRQAAQRVIDDIKTGDGDVALPKASSFKWVSPAVISRGLNIAAKFD